MDRSLGKYTSAQKPSSDADSAASIYFPLNQSTREIRLAYILPARNTDEIVEVRLITVALDDKPGYDALSYCWGDPNVTSAILVNGHQRKVTVNLETALRTFRNQSAEATAEYQATEPTAGVACVILWVDAISINQEDIVERGRQVMIMPDIYRSARTVKAWLGDVSHAAMDAFQRFYIKAIFRSEIDKSDETSWTYDDVEDVLSDLRSILRPEESAIQFFRALEGFGQSSYWTRKWIVQEAVLARQFTVHTTSDSCLNFSDEMIHRWSKLDRFLDELYRAMFAVHAFQSLRFGISFRNRLDVGPIINQLRQRFASIITGSVEALVAETSPEAYEGESEIAFIYRRFELDFLTLSRHTKCADPRDCVFAVQGFLPKSITITPDYNATVAEVFCRFTLRIIERMRSFEILATGFSSIDDLPSWVPDFRSEASEGFHPSSHASVIQKISLLASSSRILVAPALFISKIVTIIPRSALGGQLNSERAIEFYESWESAYQATLSTLAAKDKVVPYPTRLENLDVFWNILDKSLARGAPPKDYSIYDARRRFMKVLRGDPKAKALQQLEKGIVKGLTDEGARQRFIKQMRGPYDTEEPSQTTEDAILKEFRAFNDRFCLFVTECGLTGSIKRLENAHVAPGDSIVIIATAKRPFCVRSVQHGKVQGGMLLGTCFIPGIMDGEAVRLAARQRCGTEENLESVFKPIFLV